MCVEFIKAHLIAPANLEKYNSLLKPTVEWNKKINAEELAYWNEYNRRHANDGAVPPPMNRKGRRTVPPPGDPCSYYDGIRFCPQGVK